MAESFAHMRRISTQDAKQSNEKKYKDSSKQRLQAMLRKKFQTTMIGALAKFEDKLGYLWGHGIPAGELTPEEREFREIWEEIRTEILNNGNNQIRSTNEELTRYDVTWNGYQYNFPIAKG